MKLLTSPLIDNKFNPLEIGAMYCCGFTDNGATQYGELLRYAGNGRFLDANTLEETSVDYDFLVRQAGSTIDLA